MFLPAGFSWVEICPLQIFFPCTTPASFLRRTVQITVFERPAKMYLGHFPNRKFHLLRWLCLECQFYLTRPESNLHAQLGLDCMGSRQEAGALRVTFWPSPLHLWMGQTVCKMAWLQLYLQRPFLSLVILTFWDISMLRFYLISSSELLIAWPIRPCVSSTNLIFISPGFHVTCQSSPGYAARLYNLPRCWCDVSGSLSLFKSLFPSSGDHMSPAENISQT